MDNVLSLMVPVQKTYIYIITVDHAINSSTWVYRSYYCHITNPLQVITIGDENG